MRMGSLFTLDSSPSDLWSESTLDENCYWFLNFSIHVLSLWPEAMLIHPLRTSNYTKDPRHRLCSWIVMRKCSAHWHWAMPGLQTFHFWPGWHPSFEPGEWAVLTLFSLLPHLTPESCHAFPTNPEIRLFVCLFREYGIVSRPDSQTANESTHWNTEEKNSMPYGWWYWNSFRNIFNASDALECFFKHLHLTEMTLCPCMSVFSGCCLYMHESWLSK